MGDVLGVFGVGQGGMRFRGVVAGFGEF